MNQNRSSPPLHSELVPSALLPSDPGMYWRLTSEEEKVIWLLTEAHNKVTQCNSSYVTAMDDVSLNDENCPAIQQILSQIVDFFSALPDFSSLWPEDQAALLGANAMRLLLLRASFASFPLHELLGQGPGRGPEQGPGRGGESLPERVSGLQRALQPVLRGDVATVALLQCVLVFDPRAPAHIMDRQRVNAMQDKYLILLKHYLESQCSYLFWWQYVDSMMELMKQSKALAASLLQHWPAFTPSLTRLLNTLRASQPLQADT